VSFVGKGVEILKRIAEHEARNEPCTEYLLRQSQSWSSRTVWKQIRRFRREGLIERTKLGYGVTDLGFLFLIPALESRQERRLMLERAVAKYPRGSTDKAWGSLLTHDIKVDLKKELMFQLKKPNVFLLARTNMEGKVTRLWFFRPAVDPETNKCILKLQARKHGEKWRTVDLQR